jgi:hypothetical protein
LLAGFLAGAFAATVVAVGVVADLGETDWQTAVASDQRSTPSVVLPVTTPPTQAAPTGSPKAQPTSKPRAPATAAPKNAAPKKAAPETVATAKNGATPAKTGATKTGAAKKPKPAGAKPKATSKGPATSQAPPPARRFAWAPVPGAISYRVELFRGDEQILRATTKSPVYELSNEWRHGGRVERLTPGTYRWYVWPVNANGPAAAAVVQATLDVP